MNHTSVAWFMTSGRLVTVTEKGMPTCMGNDIADDGCYTTPHWVLTYSLNPSGLPDSAVQAHAYACDLHLDEAAHWIRSRGAQHCTLTAYTGT